jgi:translation initiation factor 5B
VPAPAADDNGDNDDNDDGEGGESDAAKKKKKKKKKKDAKPVEGAEAEAAAKPKKKVSKLAAQLRAQQEARRIEEERIMQEAEEQKRIFAEEMVRFVLRKM